MKFPVIIFALIFAFLGATLTFAQDAPPPPPAPDYFPQNWKEFTYENDNVKIRFPKEPKLTIQTEKQSFGVVTTREYEHKSFIKLTLTVVEYPSNFKLEEVAPSKVVLQRMRDSALEGVKQFNPRIIKESDITVEGHAGKFMHIEAGNADVLRAKFFVANNHIYFLLTEVKKGLKHGSNYEKDFEKVAMAFLDSVQLIISKK